MQAHKHILKFIFIFFLYFQGYGQDNLKINVSSFPEELNPGDIFTVIFEASRQDSTLDLGEAVFNIPDAWKVILKKISQKRQDSTVFKYLYTIQTPTNSPPSLYRVTFSLGGFAGEVVSSKTIQIQLREIRKIEVIVADHPEFIKEGEDMFVEYIVQNLGNTPEKIHLETSRGTIENIKDTLTIAPNELQKVVLKHRIPKTEQYNWQFSSDLRVFTTFQKNPVLQLVSVPVYSTNVKKSDPFLRFPVEAGVGFVRFKIGDKTFSGMQYFLDGQGYIDFEKKHNVELLLRGPNQFSFPMFASYDQYLLRYSYDSKLNVEVGDYNNRFNNLMEFSRFGRGFRADYTVNKRHQFEAFYNKARFFINQRNSFGGSYKYRFKGDTHIGINYIHKELNISDQPFFTTNIIGASAKVNRNSLLIESEVALGEAQNKIGVGFYNNVQYTFKKVQVRNQAIYASKNFFGFYNNSVLFNTSVNYAITSKISIGVNNNYSRINPSLDALAGISISPRSFSTMIFASYSPNQKNLLFANYTTQEREDRQQPSLFYYKEDFGNLSYQFNGTKFNLFTQSRFGSAINYLATDDNRRKRTLAFLLQPTLGVTPWLWVGGYFEYQNTAKFSQLNVLEDLYYYGGNIRANYKKYLSLNFMYRNNYAPDDFFERRSFLDGSLIFELDRHKFSFSASKVSDPFTNSIASNQLFYSLKYTLKLNMPVAKNRSLGNVSGKIVTLSNDINRSGIILQMGQYKVLTDANGVFSFPNITPDTYYIQMKDETNPASVISTIKTPVRVEVSADSTKIIEIPLVHSGVIAGKVELDNITDDEFQKVPIIYIKLTNGEEKHITSLDKKQRFSFKEMRPGRWSVSLLLVGNNDNYEISNQYQDIEIEPNSLKNIFFTVHAIERKIYFSDKKFNLSSNK
jgi:hypothetical protein